MLGLDCMSRRGCPSCKTWKQILSEQGVNWFGFETGEAMVNGLYSNYANPRNFSQVGDFATIVYRQQALGFNAVRLPFRHISQLPQPFHEQDSLRAS